VLRKADMVLAQKIPMEKVSLAASRRPSPSSDEDEVGIEVLLAPAREKIENLAAMAKENRREFLILLPHPQTRTPLRSLVSPLHPIARKQIQREIHHAQS
jgi:hypothetical protein